LHQSPYNTPYMSQTLSAFLQPKRLAIVGASARPESVGHALLRNLVLEAPADRVAEVFAVNPKGGEIDGCRIYKSLAEIGQDIDLIVVAVPPRFIPDLMAEAAAVGVRAAIIISAGFGETGEDGQNLQDQLLNRAREHQIRLLGPNCLGLIRPPEGLNASFAAGMPPKGHVGVISQSGALITGLISYARTERFGMSAAISTGGKADLSDHDWLSILGEDPHTHSIALYKESVRHPQAFLQTAREVSRHKPIVVLKGGSSEAGAKAASSHTGSLAGSQAAYTAAFRQSGMLEVQTIGDFMAWSRALSAQPPAPGNRLAILTNAGGPGVLAADAASRCGLELVTLSAATLDALNAVLPSVWSHNNPVDIIGDATPDRFAQALRILGEAEEVDGIVIIMTVQFMTDPLSIAESIARIVGDASWNIPTCASFIGLVGTEVGSYLDQRRIPEFNMPEQAVSAMSALMRRGAWLNRASNSAGQNLKQHPAPELQRAQQALDRARTAGQINLDLTRAREILQAAGIRYNGAGHGSSIDETVQEADRIGYPVAIKINSPDVLHKSDVGGVVLDVADAGDVRRACKEIVASVQVHQPDARIDGFSVEQQVKGTEIIIGVSRDPTWGPMIMVGMGGIFVEVYKDVSFRLLPISHDDAFEMIGEIDAQPLLDGARGRPSLNRQELAGILCRVSLLIEHTQGIEELDINPLVITGAGLVAIDARVIARVKEHGPA